MFVVEKATTNVAPQLWQPNNGIQMINDVPNSSKATFPCMALSKNDSYVMSACGAKISLFNMMTFKVISKLMLIYFVVIIVIFLLPYLPI